MEFYIVKDLTETSQLVLSSQRTQATQTPWCQCNSVFSLEPSTGRKFVDTKTPKICRKGDDVINCPSSWREAVVPENCLFLAKAKALVISCTGTDISSLCISGEFSAFQTHGYFGGKRCFGLFFTWGENQKLPTTVKSFCSSNAIGQENFLLHFCVPLCSQCTMESLCSHGHYKRL